MNSPTVNTAQSPIPTVLESLGVLAGILTQAALVTGWDRDGFSRASLYGNGDIQITLRAEETAQDLADRIGLTDIERIPPYRPELLFPGHDNRCLVHVVYWRGSFAGHVVEIHAQWNTPLEGQDLAEGEELA